MTVSSSRRFRSGGRSKGVSTDPGIGGTVVVVAVVGSGAWARVLTVSSSVGEGATLVAGFAVAREPGVSRDAE